MRGAFVEAVRQHRLAVAFAERVLGTTDVETAQRRAALASLLLESARADVVTSVA